MVGDIAVNAVEVITARLRANRWRVAGCGHECGILRACDFGLGHRERARDCRHCCRTLGRAPVWHIITHTDPHRLRGNNDKRRTIRAILNVGACRWCRNQKGGQRRKAPNPLSDCRMMHWLFLL